jgi:hypothetical protein
MCSLAISGGELLASNIPGLSVKEITKTYFGLHSPTVIIFSTLESTSFLIGFRQPNPYLSRARQEVSAYGCSVESYSDNRLFALVFIQWWCPTFHA